MRLTDRMRMSSQNRAPVMSAIESVLSTARGLGINLRGYTKFSLDRFCTLPQSQQYQSIEHLEQIAKSSDFRACISGLEFPEVLTLQWTMNALNLRVPDDFYHCIRPDDVIEVYSFESMTQVWRNLRFLSCCTYDLLTIMTTPLAELFARDEKINHLIHERAFELFDSPKTGLWQIPEHDLTQILDNHKQVVRISPGFIGPVFDQNNTLVGFVSSLRAEVLGSAYAHVPNVFRLPQ